MNYYDSFKPKREQDVLDFEKEILLTLNNNAYKRAIKLKFKNRRNKIISYRLLWYGIVSCILQGDSQLKTVDELLSYLWYSKYQNNNKNENKWSKKYENKIYNTHSR